MEKENILKNYEINKWYEFENGNKHIGKCSQVDEYNIQFMPWLCRKGLYLSQGDFAPISTKLIKELKVEDECIQSVLPEGHEDKIKSVLSLIKGEAYYHEFNSYSYIFECRESEKTTGGSRVGIQDSTWKNHYSNGRGSNLRVATKEEKAWLYACKSAGKFIPKEEVLKPTIPEYVEVLAGFDTKHVGEIFKTSEAVPNYENWTKGKTWEYYLSTWPAYFKPSTKEAYEAQIAPKSLVGRYVKALVDKPNSGAVTKGEIGQIIIDNPITLAADFPSQTGYSISRTMLTEGIRYELMPEEWRPEKTDTMEDLLAEAKRRYPKNTKIIILGESKITKTIVGELKWSELGGYIVDENSIAIYSKSAKIWAVIVNEEWKPQVGDWVVRVKDDHLGMKVGDVDQISSIIDTSIVLVKYRAKSGGAGNHSLKNFRKAELHEIPQEKVLATQVALGQSNSSPYDGLNTYKNEQISAPIERIQPIIIPVKAI